MHTAPITTAKETISSNLPNQNDPTFPQLAGQLADGFSQLLDELKILPSIPVEQLLRECYLPIADWLFKQAQQHGKGPFFVGVNGAQGSGKSTLCSLLSYLLQEGFALRVATLSIDDIYLTRQQRLTLAEQQHPLLKTRGVPGTHDVALGCELFHQLCADRGSVALPQFDKSIDDRAASQCWPTVTLPVEIVLFEGWCVASQPQSPEQLVTPINALEAEEDKDGHWRHFVNQQLAENYPALFDYLDCLIMLQVPDFSKVLEWRSLQEQKLKERHGEQPHVMDQQALQRFIMHYERVTRANLAELPTRSDLLLKLDESHQITTLQARQP